MGRGLKETHSTNAVASRGQPLKKGAHFSSGIPSSSTASALSSSADTPSSAYPTEIVREVKRLWESCTTAATREKLLRASERLFEILSCTLEQQGLIYPVETVVNRTATPGSAPGPPVAHAARTPPLSGVREQSQTDSLRLDGKVIREGRDISSGNPEEDKFCGWLRAAAEHFLVLLCELIDSEAEDLQQAGLRFCLRIVAHTHRVRASVAFSTGDRGRDGGRGGTVRGGGRDFDKPLTFPLSTYQLLVSRLLHARHFSAGGLAKHLILQLVPHPDLRFHFIIVLRKILEEEHQRQQQKQHEQQKQKPQQQQQDGQKEQQEQQEAKELRQWYRWPPTVSAATAAERIYMILAGLPIPQLKKSGTARSNSKKPTQEASRASDSEDEVSGAERSSTSVEGCSSSEEEETTSSTGKLSDGSSSSSSNDSSSSTDSENEERDRYSRGKRKEWKTRKLQDSRMNATCDYAVKSCYLLRINTRRCCDTSEYRRLYERVWLLFLRCSTQVWNIAQIQGKTLLHHLLLSLPRVLLPHMSNPLLLADFFLKAFDTRRGGVAALEGSDWGNPVGNISSITSSRVSPSRSGNDSNASVLTVNRVNGSPDTSTSSGLCSCCSTVPGPNCGALHYEAHTDSVVTSSFSEEAVLALSGLFYLLTRHGLGDPDALLLEGSDAGQEQQDINSFSDGGEDIPYSISKSEEAGSAAGGHRYTEKEKTCSSDSDNKASPTTPKLEDEEKEKTRATVNEIVTSSSAAVSATQVHDGVLGPGESGRKNAGDVSAVKCATSNSAAAGEAAIARDSEVADGAATASDETSANGAARDYSAGPDKRMRGRTAGGGRMDVHLYGRLYALLTPAAFAVKGKARRRFLRLLSLALRSPLLPTHLISSFLKKSCRVACLVSPGGALYLAGLVFVLLRRHAAVCSPLVDVPPALAQELIVEGGDHFSYNTLSLLRHRPSDNQEGRSSETETKKSCRGGGEREEKYAKRYKSLSAAQQVGTDDGEGADKQDASKSPARDAAGPADVGKSKHAPPKNLLELILECSPGSDEHVCKEGKTAAVVERGALLATESVKQQAQTSLWELELLRLHYDPAVRQFVSLFDVAFSSGGSSGKHSRATAVAATLDPDDYYWRLDWDALLHHELKIAAKRARTGAPPLANRAPLPLPDVMQLARVAVGW